MTGYDFGLGYLASDVYPVPIAVPGHTWSSVSAQASELGFFEASGGFGIESNGTLWAWGYENTWSQLGLEWLDQLYNTEYWACQGPGGASPLVFEGGQDGDHNTLQALQVGWDTRWKTVCSAGTEMTLWGYSSANLDYSVTVYTLGLKMDGTLWVWGKSPFASVTNQRVYLTPATHPFPGVPYPQVPAAIPAPQQVGTNLWSFADIEAAITTNGDLYMWGENDCGSIAAAAPLVTESRSWEHHLPSAAVHPLKVAPCRVFKWSRDPSTTRRRTAMEIFSAATRRYAAPQGTTQIHPWSIPATRGQVEIIVYTEPSRA